MKLITNIIDNPTENKFRTFKGTNPKILSTIFSLEGGIADFILAFGFEQNGEQYEFKGDDLEVLKKGKELTSKAVENLKNP